MLSSLDFFLDVWLCSSTGPFYWFVRGLKSEELLTEQKFLLITDSVLGKNFPQLQTTLEIINRAKVA